MLLKVALRKIDEKITLPILRLHNVSVYNYNMSRRVPYSRDALSSSRIQPVKKTKRSINHLRPRVPNDPKRAHTKRKARAKDTGLKSMSEK